MHTRHFNVYFGLGVGVLAAVLAANHWSTRALPFPPRTVHEAVAMAGTLGFFCSSDEPDGVPRNGLVVSDRALTREALAELHMNSPRDPCWIGVARVSGNWRSFMANYDPSCAVIWGELFVYGDPEVIRRLTGMFPEQPRV